MEKTNFVVSARKYRPQTFESVVGQKAITRTLKNAILNNKLAHAYLFCGPRGVGKTTCARIFAKTINCFNIQPNGEACNACPSCESFNSGRSLNIHELDAASNNSVEDIRRLIDQVRIPPQLGKYSVYIIDEVHMLSQSAFNAFLKTLEEPPKHAIFILATTEKHKILPTILSRCQIYDFQRIKISDIVEHLQYIASQEGVTTDVDALSIIAQKADGALRDALSMFDQLVSFTDGNVIYQNVLDALNVIDYEYYFKLVELIKEYKLTEILLLIDEILYKGFETSTLIYGLSQHFRDLLVAQDPNALSLLQVSENVKNRYLAQSKSLAAAQIVNALDILSRADSEHRQSIHKRLHLEIVFLQLCNVFNNQKNGVTATVQPETTKQTNTTETQTQDENKVKKQATTTNFSVSAFVKQQQKELNISTNLLSLQNQQQSQVKTYDKESLTKLWQNFVENYKKEERLYAILTSINIELEGTNLTLVLNNELQKDKILSLQPTILDFFKENGVELKIQITVKPQATKKLMTNEQKYEFLKNKNPFLDKFRDELNLEF